MADEIITKSWGSRLKDAFVGILAGIALIIGAIILIFWNEQHSLHTTESLEQAQKQLIEVQNSPVNPLNNMKVIYTNGLATTKDKLKDSMFGMDVNALGLFRKVEMYQWTETVNSKIESQVGGSEKETKTYSYSKVWSESLIDSSNFKTPDGHQNPGAMPVQSKKQYAEKVTVGDFSLPYTLITQIDGTQPVDFININKESVKDQLHKPIKIVENVLYAGQDINNPQPGDLRISFTAVYPQNVSFIGQQAGDSVQDYLAPAGETVMLLSTGIKSPLQMFNDAQSENNLITWILRAVSLLMLIGGFSLILNPLVVLADILPFLGTLMGFGTGFIAVVLGITLWVIFTAIAWFATRPLWSIGLIALFIISGYFLIKRRAARKRELAPIAVSKKDE